MEFHQNTVRGFFGVQKIQFSIPAYQRAYSWEEKQLKTFFEDLLEQRSVGESNTYCYGNVLLETITKGKKYEIIDGQQRITTISVFLRALLNALKEKSKNGESLLRTDGDQLDFTEEEEVFFKSYGTIKLLSTEYDRPCFETLIVDNEDSFSCQTPSQKRISFAKKYFSSKLAELNSEELLAILDTVENAIINQIELVGKKESSLMFELQNNRGKDLTNLEKLKSFLMYQLYVYSVPDETEANINYVSGLFDHIYNIVNQMSAHINSADDDESSSADTVNEDNILIYHSYAYSKKNFGYRSINDILEELPRENKVEWIKKYALQLHKSFSSINSVLGINNEYLLKLKTMKMPFFVYPFIIKGFENKESLPDLFRLMEVLSFRYKLVNSRADIRGRLTELIRVFDGNVTELAISMKKKMNESYYWGDTKVLEILNGNMYKSNMINYFLWEYEQELQRAGYIISGNIKIENESIEHISPQTEEAENIASGYEVGTNGLYTKEFREEYINKLGNLMLISQSHNSSIGNKPFKDKLESYKSNPLLRQQAKIAEYVTDDNILWNSDSIDMRHNELIQFAMTRWNYLQE